MSADILQVLGLGCLPFLGWLVIVAPLLITAAIGNRRETPRHLRDARRQLLRFFAAMLGLALFTLGLFLLVHLIV